MSNVKQIRLNRAKSNNKLGPMGIKKQKQLAQLDVDMQQKRGRMRQALRANNRRMFPPR